MINNLFKPDHERITELENISTLLVKRTDDLLEIIQNLSLSIVALCEEVEQLKLENNDTYFPEVKDDDDGSTTKRIN